MSIDTLRQQMYDLNQDCESIFTNVGVEYAPLVRAAKARLAEAFAFIEISVEDRAPADSRLARLDAVMRETMQMADRVVERAGVDLHDGISIDEVEGFLDRQEKAEAALEQARIAATAVVVHLDRALKMSIHAS